MRSGNSAPSQYTMFPSQSDLLEPWPQTSRSCWPSIIHATCGSRVVYFSSAIYTVQVWINTHPCLVFARDRGIILSKVIYHLWKQSSWQAWEPKFFMERKNRWTWGWIRCMSPYLITLKVKDKKREEGIKTLAMPWFQTIKYRDVYDSDVIFVARTGWWFYFICKKYISYIS